MYRKARTQGNKETLIFTADEHEEDFDEEEREYYIITQEVMRTILLKEELSVSRRKIKRKSRTRIKENIEETDIQAQFTELRDFINEQVASIYERVTRLQKEVKELSSTLLNKEEKLKETLKIMLFRLKKTSLTNPRIYYSIDKISGNVDIIVIINPVRNVKEKLACMRTFFEAIKQVIASSPLDIFPQIYPENFFGGDLSSYTLFTLEE